MTDTRFQNSGDMVILNVRDIQPQVNMNTPSDVSLVKQIQDGEEQALIAIHERYANLVYSVAYHVLQNRQDAEEVTQDVFMRLWNKSDSYQPHLGQFKTWLLTITRRISIDKYRKRKSREPNTGLFSMDEHPRLWETELVSHQDTELEGTIRSAIKDLTPEQQDAIQLAYFYGMSHSEIADYLNRPLGTVKSHIRQGMQQLRRVWIGSKK